MNRHHPSDTKHLHNRLFKCTECGAKRECPKKRRTKIGHIKTMYCFSCMKETDFIQIEEGEEWTS